MKYSFIQAQQPFYPVTVLCRVMQVGTTAYYAWRSRPAVIIDSSIWRLCQRMKVLFTESRQSLGSRQMMKQLRKEGVDIGRYRVRGLMKRLDLVVKQKKRFVVTTDSRHTLAMCRRISHTTMRAVCTRRLATERLWNVNNVLNWVSGFT